MPSRQAIAFALLTAFLILNASHVFASDTPRLQIAIVEQGSGGNVAPAGQTTTLKIEILNAEPGDIYLVQGTAYLDPNLNGSSVIIHSENLGRFQLRYLESALWTFNLDMPAKIQAKNETNGLPQVVLMIQVTYSTGTGLLQMQQEPFVLNVPGASVGQPNILSWAAVVAAATVLVAGVLAYQRYRKTQVSLRNGGPDHVEVYSPNHD